jgi:sugar phosphate isomerase/epimerase
MWSYAATVRKGEMDIAGFVRKAKEIGVDGVELLDYFWKDRAAELPIVEAALSETGLPVGVYSVGNDFVNPDSGAREAQLQIIRGGVDNAVHFGAETVRVFAGNLKEGISFDDAFDWIVAGLSQAAQYAESNGVVLALENHGKLAGKSDQVLRILEAVNNPAMKANPDTGNFLLVHQAPHMAVQELARYAGMVHFKDFAEVPDDYEGFAYTSLDGLKYRGTAIGEGEVALTACINALRAVGYDGWLNIEYEGDEDPMTALPRSVKNARAIMQTGVA